MELIYDIPYTVGYVFKSAATQYMHSDRTQTQTRLYTHHEPAITTQT